MTGKTSGEAEERVALIYERYASNVAAYAVRRSSSRSDAADAVAETFLVAWRRRDKVPEEPNTLPWLYGVTRRVLANQRRTDHRRGRLRARLVTEFATYDVGPSPFEEGEEFRRVASALRQLSDDDAELLRLTAWEALTPTEIATVFGIAPGTARQRISRARQRLRKQLAADGGDTTADRWSGVRPAPDPGCRKAPSSPPVDIARPDRNGGPGQRGLGDPQVFRAIRGGLTP